MLIQLHSHHRCPSITSHHCCRFCSCSGATWPPKKRPLPTQRQPRSRDSWNECRGQSSVARRRPLAPSIVRWTPQNPMQRRLPTALSAAPRPCQAQRSVEHRLPPARHGRVQRRQGLQRGRHRKQRSSRCRAMTPLPAATRGAGAPRPRPFSAAAAERTVSTVSQITNPCSPGPDLTPEAGEPSRCVP